MITGFNTDVEHDGIVYHVQTEDKGLESPIILSLVYTGGAILASKRSPYEDLIASGYSDEALAERLKRQHRLICAAIHSGRIADLKKMSGKPEAGLTGSLRVTGSLIPAAEIVEEHPTTGPEVVVGPEVVEEEFVDAPKVIEEEALTAESEEVFETQDFIDQEIVPEPDIEREEDEVAVTAPLDADIILGIDEQQEMIWELLSKKKEVEEQAAKAQEPEPETPQPQVVVEPVLPPPPPVAPYTVYDQRRVAESIPADAAEGVVIKLLDDDEFFSGELRMLRVFVSERRGEKERALVNFPVSIKILGTAFRPLIFSLKTERDGVASVSTEIPEFTTGRAAVLIRVVSKDSTAELRRVIHPSSEVKQ